MTCNSAASSTVFQSYQDNRKGIMTSCMRWNPVYDKKDIRSQEFGTTRKAGKCLSLSAPRACIHIIWSIADKMPFYKFLCENVNMVKMKKKFHL